MNKKLKILLLASSIVFVLLFLIIGRMLFVEEQVIKSASEYDYPPFALTSKDGRADGFSVELLRTILEIDGHEVDFYVGSWSRIKNDLIEGKIDVLPLVGRTPEREAVYDFSVPYATLYGAIFTRDDDTSIQTLADLKGKEIVVMAGDNAEEFIRRKNTSEQIITTETFEEAFRLLSDGKYDAVVTQEKMGKQLLRQEGIENVVVASEIKEFKQDFTFAVKKGNNELLSVLNNGLSGIIASGKFQEIYDKWLSEDKLEGEATIKQVPDEKEGFKYVKELIKQKTEDVANQVTIYLKLNPDKTVADLQADDFFQEIAIQKIGKTGYTAITDQNTGEQYFSPQKEMVGRRLDEFKDQIPVLWDFFERELLGACNDAGTFYDWLNSEGVVKEKYLYSVCIETKTADGKTLGLDVSTYLDEYKEKNSTEQSQNSQHAIEELSIKLIALQTAKQIDDYLENNPTLTIDDLQADEHFKKIAVQLVATGGYTAIMDAQSGYFYFHPQDALVNTDPYSLEETLPAFWKSFNYPLSEKCQETSGYYNWMENDGLVTKKYLSSACPEYASADGRNLIVIAAAYVNESEAAKYLDEYNFKKDQESVEKSEQLQLVKDLIKQKAEDVANQVEIYLGAYPNKTISELSKDSLFREIALQQVGKNGYTAIFDYKRLSNVFHVNSEFEGLDFSTLADSLPAFWNIIQKSRDGYNSEGHYDWVEPNGDIRGKYMYNQIVSLGTSDDIAIAVSAAVYLDEYLVPASIEQKPETFEELSIKLKAMQVVEQIDNYLKKNPDLTLIDLQEDIEFKKLAIQLIGETGYTGLIDSQSGYFYFHPQERLVNTDSYLLHENLPNWWDIFNRTIGDDCQDSSGYYEWKEEDGTITEKYLYTACLKQATADGKKMFVGATAYLDEFTATKYLERYELRKDFAYARNIIKQKAIDVAKQVEIYINSYPDKTLVDLQADEYFQEIAVQPVGVNGYTTIHDYISLISRFHVNPDIVDSSLVSFKSQSPEFWDIISSSSGGHESEGIYDWIEVDGSKKKKYLYSAVVNSKTADGVGLMVAATDYLDEYEMIVDDYGPDTYEPAYENSGNLLQYARVLSKNIEIVTNSFVRDINAISQTSGIRELLTQVKDEGILVDTEIEKKYYPQDKEKYWKDVQNYFLRLYQQNTEEINFIRLFYKNGYVVNGVVFGEEDTNDYKGDKAWFEKTMDPLTIKSDEVYISPISIARITDSPVIRYAMPIEIDGERLGLVIIVFKANAIFKLLQNESGGNVLFLDKAYENAEGQINKDWVVTLADSRYPDKTMDESQISASVITADQLTSDSGFLEFEDNNRTQTGAYQKIDILGREWYVVTFVDSEELKGGEQKLINIDSVQNVDFVLYIYWFLGGLLFGAFVLRLLYYLKVIKLERTTLYIVIVFIITIVCALFVFGSYTTVNKLKIYFKNSYIDQHLQSENILAGKVVDLIGDMSAELDYVSKIYASQVYDEETFQELLVGAYTRNKDFVHAVYRINKNNVIENMYPIDEKSIGADIGEQTHIKKSRETLKPVLSDIFDAVEGFQGVTLHYPVIKNGHYDGTVAFLVNIDNFFSAVSLFPESIYGYESFLLDTGGQIITSNYEDYIGKNILTSGHYKEAKKIYENILASDGAGCEEFILEKQKQISTYVPINVLDNKWIMAINGKEQDIYQNIDDTLNVIWFFTLVALITFVIFGYFFSHFLTRSLRMEVESKTSDIKKQSSRIKKQLENEELIRGEKEKLLHKQHEIKNKLEEKVEEMEKFQRLTVNRELKMIELKEKIKKLEEVIK